MLLNIVVFSTYDFWNYKVKLQFNIVKLYLSLLFISERERADTKITFHHHSPTGNFLRAL